MEANVPPVDVWQGTFGRGPAVGRGPRKPGRSHLTVLAAGLLLLGGASSEAPPTSPAAGTPTVPPGGLINVPGDVPGTDAGVT